LRRAFRFRVATSPGYSLHYIPKFPNSILILVQYTDNVPAGTVDKEIDTAKLLVKKYASNYDWTPWVKIEVQGQRTKE
jgi:hypothetical protein